MPFVFHTSQLRHWMMVKDGEKTMKHLVFSRLSDVLLLSFTGVVGHLASSNANDVNPAVP